MEQHQNKLLDIFKSKSNELADMYRGAIFVLKQTNNPQRFVHASHSLRELLNNFAEKFINVKISTKWGAGDRIIDFVEKNIKPELLDGTNSESELNFNEETIEVLKKLITLRNEYCTAKSLKNEFSSGIRELDTYGIIIPELFDKEIEERYENFRQYFIGICHQKKIKIIYENDREEFFNNLTQFEFFLLNILSPKPMKDIIEIDNLIDKIESNAK